MEKEKKNNFNITLLLLVVMCLFLPAFILQIYVALLSYQRDKLARSAKLRISPTDCYFCLCRTKARPHAGYTAAIG